MSDERPPQALLWDLMRGAMNVQALRVAAELGIADELADGPRPVADVADSTGADANTLHRFLRALASDGVFAEEEPGVFRNTGASELLRRGGEWNAFAHFFGGVWYQAFADSLDAVRTGDETFTRTIGDGWWTWLAARPEEATLFNRAMQGGAEWRVERFADVEWRDSETIVDVGGGNGTLLIELLRRRPGLHGVVFDLPEIAREAETRIAEAGLAGRCQVFGGDAFESVPAGGDAYILAVVLHDWDDDAAATILRNVRSAAPDHARLFIADSVIEPGNEPNGIKWLDLLMLVLNRGRERTEPEWRTLIEGAGFHVERIGDLIEARCR